MTWYDVSIGPNLAAYNFVRNDATNPFREDQYAVIAPTLHCGYKRATEKTVVGERDMGDARLDYDEMTFRGSITFSRARTTASWRSSPR